jgi:integrase
MDSTVDIILSNLENTRSKLFYKIILECSCKVSELSKIKVKDIQKNKIKFPKRTIRISTELGKLIEKYLREKEHRESPFLFSTRQSPSITSKRIRQIIQKTSKEILGNELNPEELRKFSITSKLKTKNLKEVKKEANLKRLDKREYLSKQQIQNLEQSIENKRDKLIFELLLNNLKSSEIVNFKVEDILKLNVSKDLIRRLESYAASNRVSFGEYLFTTRQKTHLSKVMIFKIITNLGKKNKIRVNPQILNNTAIANASLSKKPSSELNSLGIKTRAFHLQGGFIENE